MALILQFPRKGTLVIWSSVGIHDVKHGQWLFQSGFELRYFRPIQPSLKLMNHLNPTLSLMKEGRMIQYLILSVFLCAFVSLLSLLLYSCSTNKYISSRSTIDPPSHTSSTSKWSTRCKFKNWFYSCIAFYEIFNSYFLLHHLVSSFSHL